MFFKAFNYRGKGVTLWHAIHQDYRSRGSHAHIQAQLAFFYSDALVRKPSESVDDYWNRFQNLVRQLLQSPEPHTFSQLYFRKRSLTTLGTGFEYLVEDEKNLRLDPALLQCSDVHLISQLREIQANKSSSVSPTVASVGYANAAKPTPQSVPASTTAPVQTDDPNLEVFRTLFIEQAKYMTDQTEAINKCVQALGSKSQPTRLKYCWTHGGNFSHHSGECKKPADGHKKEATWKNRMEGSDKNVKSE